MWVIPAPFALRQSVGRKEDFFIHSGYTIREDNLWFDDRGFTDEFQKEIYEYARRVADEQGYKGILDYGCGSGFKLIANFFGHDTIGIDLPDTISYCRTRWGGRYWLTPEDENPELQIDLAICADVIEHFSNPDELLSGIAAWKPKRLIISTPERDELCLGTHDGPPKNLHHVREWNFAEFHAYIGSHFNL